MCVSYLRENVCPGNPFFAFSAAPRRVPRGFRVIRGLALDSLQNDLGDNVEGYVLALS